MTLPPLELKEKYMEYQMLMQQLQQMQQNVTALEKHITDLTTLNMHLETLKDLKEDTDTLIPLGSGIFLRGKISNTAEVVMNVGSGVCVDQTLEEAQQTVLKQLEEIHLLYEQMQAEVENTSFNLQHLRNEFQQAREKKIDAL